MVTTIETHIVDWLPSIAWLLIETPDETLVVLAGSQAAVEEAPADPETPPRGVEWSPIRDPCGHARPVPVGVEPFGPFRGRSAPRLASRRGGRSMT